MEKTQKEMTLELYQAVIGIPENPKDNGLIGKIDGIETLLKIQNGRVTKNEKCISNLKSKIRGIIIGISVFGGLVAAVVTLISK